MTLVNAVARTSDPDTSHTAAASQTPARVWRVTAEGFRQHIEWGES